MRAGRRCGAAYDEVIEIDLSALEPLVAAPHSPDAVRPVREVAGTAVQQVCVGSCTNSSYRDLAIVAAVLKDKVVHPGVSLTVNPGSKQVFEMIAASGVLGDLIAAGARILESGCGPCIGMGQAPASGAVSVRTFNRNFEGRSGTRDAAVYLASPEVAAAAALTGATHRPAHAGRGAVHPPLHRAAGYRRQHDRSAGRRTAARWKCCAGRISSRCPSTPACRRTLAGRAAAEGGRQHHHRPHHARRGEGAAAALEYPGHQRVRLRARGCRLSRRAPRRRAAASSSAAAITARGPAASTPRWRRCTWG